METLKIKISNESIKIAKQKWSSKSINKVLKLIDNFNETLDNASSINEIYDLFAYMYECWTGGDIDPGMPTKCLWFFLKQNNITNNQEWRDYEHKVIAHYRMLNNCNHI